MAALRFLRQRSFSTIRSTKHSLLKGLLKHLSLERIEAGIFRGSSVDLGWGRVYGGQVMAQALAAAQHTLPEDRQVHSMHCYFLLPGDPKTPIVYDVEQIRDGGSLSARRVKAIQHGQPIFFLTASFQTPGREDDPPAMEHDAFADLSHVPLPEQCESKSIVMQRHAESIPKPLRERLTATDAWSTPIEIRPVDIALPGAKDRDEPRSPTQSYWFRAACPIQGKRPLSDDPREHQKVLAYASDFGLLATALRPHGVETWSPELQVATIDHSMWFHKPFRADEWLFARMQSPTASGGRGLSTGEIFSRDAETGEYELVANTAQQGVMRVKRTKKKE
jgi:acyl-CoA thioesterase-2